MHRDRVEQAAAITVLLGFLGCLSLIVLAPIFGWPLKDYDSYLLLVVGFLLREVGLLTVGRGSNGKDAAGPPQPPQERPGRVEVTDDIDALNNESRGK